MATSTDGTQTTNAYELLANERRRHLLRFLDESERASLEQCVDAIAASEGSETPDSDVKSHVHISLVHNHLPRLAAASVLEYDRDAGSVTTGPAFETVVQHLRERSDDEPVVVETKA